ncbi:PREDICTED: protein FAR1-RELATED SEQUENCE 5-like [Prunus mume]|uniref:Protein FAR1-RELATED SEQUENCE 5-like n=1 Tax=Prunus mume TaxID=102107 RepID=A0ABM0PVK6_PRUMU|nr:PREDICTED: protein FAR1-RELATED SEQUENCE 5-like [Prunus mume]
MDRGVETSKGGCSDSGYLGGCERLSHRALAIESGHMSVEHLDSKPKPSTRENCPAHFWVGYEKKRDTYVVTNFEPHHNHQLVTPLESPYLRCNRVVRNSDLAQAVEMRRALVRTCHTYEYMVDQYGGYLNVGFQIKDLYNKLDASRGEILLDADTEAAFSYLKGKGAMDPEFFCKFSVDEENWLGNLFSRDPTSLLEYIACGDVLIFDSTYKANMYDKPLVLFVSSNNNRSTVMFGCALLHDETFETYKWLLETFMASVKDKKPISILTDGYEAMHKSIDDVFPMSNHQLCSWHVSRNAQNNLKDDELLRNFQV